MIKAIIESITETLVFMWYALLVNAGIVELIPDDEEETREEDTE